MEDNKFIWFVSVKSGNRKVLAICEMPVLEGDVAKIVFQSADEEPVLGEVIATIMTDRNSKLHKWILEATEGAIARRKVAKVWQLRP